MAREATIKILKFSELSDKAKDRAKQDYAASNQFHAHDEYLASINKLAQHFDGKLVWWEIDWTHSVPVSPPKFEMPGPLDVELDVAEDADPNNDALFDAAFAKWIEGKLNELGTFNPETLKGHGECKLTGVGTDEDCIDGFRIAFMRDGERDLDKLMRAAFDSMLEAGQSQYTAFYENDEFSEHADANNYEFTADGKVYRE